MSGPTKIQVSSASASTAWIPLTEAMLADGVKGTGSRLTTVDTAWSISGNNVKAVATVTVSTDGIPEGYTWAAPAAVLFSALGVTQEEMIRGEKSLLISMHQKTAAGSGANFGVAIGTSSDESGDVDTLAGGGGGFRNNSTNDTIAAMGFDTTQENAGSQYSDRATTRAVTLLTCFGGYWAASASTKLEGEATLKQRRENYSGFVSSSDPSWLIIFLGGATAQQVSADVDIWFAVVDGPNFGAP